MSYFDINKVTKIFKDTVINTQIRTFQNQSIEGIEIDIEQLKLLVGSKEIILMERPVVVRGIVLPLETKGRKAPPNPVAFDSLNRYIRSVTKNKRFSLLSPHSDRGHIFALELGGSNCKYNIIPQWKGFQEHGDWRQLEKNIKNAASILNKKDNTLFLEIDIEYMNLNMRDSQEKLSALFNFNDIEDLSEERVMKCLQVFGIPVSYSFYTYPCNIYVRKPRAHSLSISYIKYLYEIAYNIYQDKSIIPFETKALLAQKALLNRGWGIKKLKLTDLTCIDEFIISNLENFCFKGTFSLGSIII